ncbi:MAG: tryptophan-rich sensory protein [Alphaproteobacteria bacterium]|nr:tryptophan-rich sensory protein [Alphaproteobacteria bacterium]MCW5741990.1 tryptophan-rich sensory protein [Alphaproteobacteria bacterium]
MALHFLSDDAERYLPATALRRAGMFVFFLVVVTLVCGIGAFYSPTHDPLWWNALKKPVGMPPSWIIPPIWMAMYVAMAVAVWLVWRSAPWHRTGPAQLLWWTQLTLNAIWMPLFFGTHRVGLAVAVIFVLLVAIGATLGTFRQHSRIAAWLLVPYVVWVGFLAMLSMQIWQLNLA